MSVAHGIKKLGVIGAGQMGLGIAYVAAVKAKVPVLLYDRSKDQVAKGLALMDKLLDKDVKKGKIESAEAAKEARERVIVLGEEEGIKGFRDVDMCVEAAREDFGVKATLFASMAAELRPDAILASNTSSISITKIAASAVPQGLQTSPETLDRARAFAVACGKEVTTSKDVPGFVSNALLMPFLNEAIMCLEKGVATRDDIDKTLRLGMNHPMGPLTLADFIGLDTCLAIQRTLYEGTGDSKYRPSVLLERMVDAGWLGKKSGKGFYDYTS
ncbi:hypothetical protein FRC01_009615 [Tulasnella sp. 417]|nr:hypothetical protein FRC01_009615 [Tulasnella sp. 417]